MEEAKANRRHKDSVFTKLFSDKGNLLELYNAVSGKNYPQSTEIEIITLSDALYMERLNDISFTIDGKLVVMIEHQSSINRNLPLRMLQYISRESERLTNSKDLYREKLVKIPTPEFIVLYNGKKDFPDYMEMKLSDSFELKSDAYPLELIVKAYNINKGRNVEMASRSPTLNGYETFIAEVNENLKTLSLSSAIKAAVRSCISRNILLSFLQENASEVENMLFTEWNWDDALAVRYEEGVEDGVEKGEARGIAIGEARGMEKLLSLWESGSSLSEAKRKLGLQ